MELRWKLEREDGDVFEGLRLPGGKAVMSSLKKRLGGRPTCLVGRKRSIRVGNWVEKMFHSFGDVYESRSLGYFE